MTRLADIIGRSFRESQTFDLDRVPTEAEVAEALPLLNGIIQRNIRPAILTIWLGDMTDLLYQRGTQFRDFTDYRDRVAVPQDVYINCKMDIPYTLRLPPSPGDGARLIVVDVNQNFGTFPLTLIGNGNTIQGQSQLILDNSGIGVSLFYRRDLADWTLLSGLTLNSRMPFPEEFDDMFVIELAMRLNPRYGQEIAAITTELFAEMKSRFMGRYISEISSAAPDLLWDSNSNIFNGDRGWTF